MKDQNKGSGSYADNDRSQSDAIPRRRVGCLVALTVLSTSWLVGCGQDRTSTRNNGTKSTVMVPVQSKSPGTPIDVPAGQSVRTQQGNVITVYQFESPADYAEAGFVIAAADVGVCASLGTTVVTQSPGVVVRAGISPRFFSLQFADGTLQEAQFPSVKDPALPEQLLQAGQCVRGWVTFHVPEQKKAAFVLFRSLSVIKWHVS